MPEQTPDRLDERLRSLREDGHFPAPAAATVRRRGDHIRRRNQAVTAVGALVAAVVVATPLLMNGTGGTRGTGVDPAGSASPTPMADVVAVEDLPEVQDRGPWKSAEPAEGIDCVSPEVLAGFEARQDLRFVEDVDRSTGAIRATEVRVTVLDYPDDQTARDQLAPVSESISDCAARDAVAPSEPWAESVTLDPPAEGSWKLYLRDASDICTDCDATRFDREGVVLVGDRLALVSLNVVGGPLQPEGLTRGMRSLMDAVAAGAAGA